MQAKMPQPPSKATEGEMLAEDWEVLSDDSQRSRGAPQHLQTIPCPQNPPGAPPDVSSGAGSTDLQQLQLHAPVSKPESLSVHAATNEEWTAIGDSMAGTARRTSNASANVTQSSPTTIVLVGAVGSGKSSTGNRILGRTAFLARHAAGPVTTVRESASLGDGAARHIVIDTPGLGELSGQGESARQELLLAMQSASCGGGRVAVAIVLSAATPFSAADKAATCSLVAQFGSSILKWSLLVFTHGDVLAADGTTLSEYLENAPAEMQTLLEQVSGRTTLLDNKQPETQNQEAASLLSAVDAMLAGSQLNTFSMPSWASPAPTPVSSALRAPCIGSFTDISASTEKASNDQCNSVEDAEGHANSEDKEARAAWLSAALAESEARRIQLERTVRDMPRLRRGIAYALTACGMLALRILAAQRDGSDSINKRSLGSSVYNMYGPFSTSSDCQSLSWTLEPAVMLPETRSSQPLDGLVALSASSLTPQDYPAIASH